MIPGKIENHTAVFTAPTDNEAKIGKLHVRSETQNGIHFMSSAWIPTPAELASINAGAPIILSVSCPDAHPAVALSAGNIPSDNDVPMKGELCYACVGGPPSNWNDLIVIDMRTGDPFVGEALEVNTREGWVVAQLVDADGNRRMDKTGAPMKTKINGKFRLICRSDHGKQKTGGQ